MDLRPGDAAHATLQYLAQGACMTMEEAVLLGEALRVHDDDTDIGAAFAHCECSRVARTARAVLSSREIGRIFHAKGMECLVRTCLRMGRRPEPYYDAMEWHYGWTVGQCPVE